MKFHQFKIRFVENKKIFFGISIAVLLIGVIFNVIFGARLDIQFTGGAIVNYSFTGRDQYRRAGSSGRGNYRKKRQCQ